MRILLTNDDGIMAPGIAALYEAVSDLGHTDVVAPETSQSAMAHAISVRTPMAVQRLHVNHVFHGFSVDGRPADCVKLAMIELLDARPDFVLSGINAGANTGINTLYSGTVAGAAEAALFGVPAIAFSLSISDELDFDVAGRIARQVFERFLTADPQPGICLNVNIPPLDRGTPRGIHVCPQATIPMQEAYQKQATDDGHVVYWLDGRFPDPAECPDADHGRIHDGYVTITPLRFDLTDHAALEKWARVDWPTLTD